MFNRILDCVVEYITQPARMHDAEYFQGGTNLEILSNYLYLRLVPAGRAELAQAIHDWDEDLKQGIPSD